MKDLGVLVPLVTPCTLAGIPDCAGLQSVTRHMLAAGCHAFFVAGSTGRAAPTGRLPAGLGLVAPGSSGAEPRAPR